MKELLKDGLIVEIRILLSLAFLLGPPILVVRLEESHFVMSCVIACIWMLLMIYAVTTFSLFISGDYDTDYKRDMRDK